MWLALVLVIVTPIGLAWWLWRSDRRTERQTENLRTAANGRTDTSLDTATLLLLTTDWSVGPSSNTDCGSADGGDFGGCD